MAGEDAVLAEAERRLESGECPDCDALAGYCRARPEDGRARFLLGAACHLSGRREEALAAFHEVCRLDPGYVEAYLAAATVALELGRAPEAETVLRDALLPHADEPRVHYSLGVALSAAGRGEEALASYRQALALAPDYADARLNEGTQLLALGHAEEALACYRQLEEQVPGAPLVLLSQAEALLALGRWEEALAACERALLLKPDYAPAHFDRAVTLSMLERFDAARQAFGAARAADEDGFRQCVARVERATGMPLRDLSPERLYLLKRYALLMECRWEGYDRYLGHLRAWLAEKRPFLEDPELVFQAFAFGLSAEERLAHVRLVSAPLESLAPVPRPPRPPRERIRLAYVSPDFRHHAASWLTRQIYGLHDRARFEVFCYAIYPGDGSRWERDIRQGCDRFVEAWREGPSEAVARRIAADGVDIVLDMAGYSSFNRMDIFARRPGAVQVEYLGFPGTTGARFMDYYLSDHVSSPPGCERFYSEKLIRLPRPYITCDTANRVGAPLPRRELGLPERGVVFCCFNSNFKIGPGIFDIWMRILQRVPGSVLWLLESMPVSAANLRREAAARGVDPARLVFACFDRDTERHLGRYAAADLFLDTPVFNAHTTAADALWAGLPVLTCPGEAHISRVAASLVKAVGLPELVVGSLTAYEEQAVRLGNHPDALCALKAKLVANRERAPLFDPPGYVRLLEQAYETLWARHCQGLPPAAFDVPDPGGR